MLLDTLRISVKNLGRKKSRNTLTVLGIAIGVASVVLISSMGEIGKYTVGEELDSLGVGALMLSGNQKMVGSSLTAEHLEVVRQSGAVESAIPILVDYTKGYMRELMMDVVVWGIDYGANQVISMEPLFGRLITKNDVSAAKPICVIDKNVALAYYKRENIVGKKISLQFYTGIQEFTVVGVVESGGNIVQGLMGDYIPAFLYIPYTTMQQYAGRETFDQIAVTLRPGIDAEVASSQLIGLVRQVPGSGNGQFKAENIQGQKKKLGKVMNAITILLSLIAGVSLVVAGLSIMTVMLVSVGERTREIGIKKSIGASRHNILLEFLIEAFVISLLGSVIGVGTGVAIIAAGCAFFKLPIILNLQLIGLCVFFAVLVGVIFGVYPASIAARLNPVDALRCE